MKNIDLGNVDINSGEVLHSNSFYPINIGYHPEYEGTLNVCIGDKSEVLVDSVGDNYKWFYGQIENVGLSDTEGNFQ